MNCCVEVEAEKNYDTFALAGTFRFLLGLILVFVGLYISTLADIQGHGLGLLLVLASPFVIFKDE